MPAEREPDRYASLDETRRRLAEEEEKRRSEDAEKIAARVRTGQYEPLRDAQRRVDEENMSRSAGRVPSAADPEREPVTEIDKIEALKTAKLKELEEKYRRGLIRSHDVPYEMMKFENQLEDKRITGEPSRAGEDPIARSQTSADRNSASDQHEPASRGEMSAARAARLERLRGIDRRIEQERRERDGDGSEPTRDSGDRSR